ncbi:MAG: hypothetical protein KDD70_03815 [Bdellovibrionales bacterium]|nr:hypothetical protein [Bdellovibrionales bacterium]
MTFLRLEELRSRTALPPEILLSLISKNAFPMKIDEEGFLTLELSEESAANIVEELAVASAQHATENNAESQHDTELLRILAERVIREEMGDIFQQALARYLEDR